MTFQRTIRRGLLSLCAAWQLAASGQLLREAPAPNDPYFASRLTFAAPDQWNLDNHETNGVRLGIDINAREAWAWSRGEGVTIAIVDNGVELSHPDLSPNSADSLHFNFGSQIADGNHPSDALFHGTGTAGLAAARGGNFRGISGAAPSSRFASWVIITNTVNPAFVGASQLAQMFGFKSDEVAVQNHSWEKGGGALVGMSLQEDAAIKSAVGAGRGGLGVVMVHAAGNLRLSGRNANDEAYMNDPRMITVAAARMDGRVASYSNPGASILVSAPSGDTTVAIQFPNPLTTDRQGTLGLNRITFEGDLSDYVWGGNGFGGTSAAAPQVSSVAALLLSYRPELGYRDVQAILALSARHWDLSDPGLQLNGAGRWVSHNLGFGVVDAGAAMRLASQWKPLGPPREFKFSNTNRVEIPDAGLRVVVSSSTGVVPDALKSIAALPGLGIQAEAGTAGLPLEDVGFAEAPLGRNISGKAALIERGLTNFVTKISNAAVAGAAAAIVFNNADGDLLRPPLMGLTTFVPVPAVMISQNAGKALRLFLQQSPDATARLTNVSAHYEWSVTNMLSIEHVGVRVQADHPVRTDLHVVLTSPSGTRSILSTVGGPDQSGLVDWTYWSAQHFFEGSSGVWKLDITDEIPSGAGVATSAELILQGTDLNDGDGDGLGDDWEQKWFGDLTQSAAGDPNADGVSNLVEWLTNSDPAHDHRQLEVLASRWSPTLLRLAWLTKPDRLYTVEQADSVSSGFQPIQEIQEPGPVAEVFLKTSDLPANRLFRVREAHLR